MPCRVYPHVAHVPCNGWCLQFFRFVMEAGLADLVLPVLASIGVSSLVRYAAPLPSPAVVFCDCPSVAYWFLGGLTAGFLLGVLTLTVVAAFFRPVGGPVWRPSPAAVSDEFFFDASEVFEPPAATYRR